TCGNSLGALLEWFAFIQAPEITISIFNSLFGNGYFFDDTKGGNVLTEVKRQKWSKTEIISKLLACATPLFALVLELLVSLFCTRFHLYQFLQPSFQNLILFCILWIPRL
ncbi:unnamed protein product, partial [Allacma fusca]